MLNIEETIREIRFLTESTTGVLINGTPDLGNNCYENSFITMCVLKMHKIPALHCQGCALVVDKSKNFNLSIDPHSWTGSPAFGVVDFSLPAENFSIYKNKVVQSNSWQVHVSSDSTLLSRVLNTPDHYPEDRFVFYYPQGGRDIKIMDIFLGPSITDSPKTVERMQSYSQDLLAKIAIHVFLLSKGERQSLANLQQNEAFNTLESWDLNAKEYLVQQENSHVPVKRGENY